jgi:hypothetical protein
MNAGSECDMTGDAASDVELVGPLPAADVLKTYCLESRSSLIGVAGGNMLSYKARASRIKRARSSSDFGINRMISPISHQPKIKGRVGYNMAIIIPSRTLP